MSDKNDPTRPGGGVFAAGELFDSEDFLRALAPEHLSLDLSHRQEVGH